MTCVRDEKKALSARKPLGTTVPQDENLIVIFLSYIIILINEAIITTFSL